MKQPKARVPRFVLLNLASAALLLGCTGEITGSPLGAGASPGGVGGTANGAGAGAGAGPQAGSTSTPPTTVNGEMVAFAPAAGSFKLLTSSELQNSLNALLGPVTLGDVVPDTFVGGFAKVGGSTVAVSGNGVSQYRTAIEAATDSVFSNEARRAALLGCTPSGVGDTACFRSFVQRFGRLAWRRELTPEELDRETMLASQLAQTFGNPIDGLRATTNAILLSPNFLYRLERGEQNGAGGFWRYTSYEMASRIAYFLTNSTPDDALLKAAEEGKLATPDGIRGEAERLLQGKTAPGRESVRSFATELFRLAVAAARAKDPSFTAYTPALQEAMIREVPSMLEDLVFEQGAPATDLFATRTTYVNADLAKHYGLDATGLTSGSWVKVTLPENGKRAGYLGTTAFLSEFANQKEGSPTQRGKFIRTVLLCGIIPDPPANVPTDLSDPPSGVHQTRRQKLEVHRQMGASCSGCHALMDPLGLPLENFDAIGAYRETDGGLPLDLTGNLDGVDFDGPIEMGQLLSKSDKAASCLVRNFYRFATGVLEGKEQEPAIAQLSTQFQSENRDLQKLMLDVVTSDGFRLVAPPL